MAVDTDSPFSTAESGGSPSWGRTICVATMLVAAFSVGALKSGRKENYTHTSVRLSIPSTTAKSGFVRVTKEHVLPAHRRAEKSEGEIFTPVCKITSAVTPVKRRIGDEYWVQPHCVGTHIYENHS